jgi:tight adherence protein B
MMLAILAALTAGACAGSAALWVLGFAGANGATARLQALRGEHPLQSQNDAPGTGISLRKRANVNLAGFTVVSANISANWAKDLERAGLTLNVKEYFIVRLIVGLVLGAVVAMVVPFPILALPAAAIGFYVVGFWLKIRIGKRKSKLEHQLVELLQMMSSGLRAGFGFSQAMESAANQLPDPLQTEIKRALRDISVGATVEQSLEALNIRVGSSDFDIVITAILIQRQVGGNLAEILENVAHTMRERERIRGEIQTLTSQQRLTGYVIGGIPVGLFVVFMFVNPEFTTLLFTDPFGRMLLGGAMVMEFMGFMVIRKIVNIEV